MTQAPDNTAGRRMGPITKFITRAGGEGVIGRVHTESGVSYDVPAEHVSKEEFEVASDLWADGRHVYARVSGDPREGEYVVGLEVEEIVPLDVDRHKDDGWLPSTNR